MKFICIGSNPGASCFLLKLKHTTILLDCGIELSSILSFFPYKPTKDLQPSKPNSSSDVLIQIGSNLFINDIHLKYHIPSTDLLDLQSIDIILISNFHNMLALPYFTEFCGFTGKMIATEPTIQIGRQLMRELVEYTSRLDSIAHNNLPSQFPLWQNEGVISNLSLPLQKQVPNLVEWKKLYTLQDVESSISKIRSCSYNEKMAVSDALQITAVSSGYCLGGCNWIIQTKHEKISYVSQSSLHARSIMSLDTKPIENSDFLILSDISDHTRTPDNHLNDLCNAIATTLTHGGNILIPVNPSDFVFDLYEQIAAFVSPSHPIFFVDPAADNIVSYSNISAEYLSKKKQEKVNIPEAPFNFKMGKVRTFKSVSDGKFGSVYQEPCVVFAGHGSLRCGDSVGLLEMWKSNPRNALVIVDKHYDFIRCLSVFEPIAMQVFHFPMDWNLNQGMGEVDKLLQQWKPAHLLVHEKHAKKINFANIQDMSSFKHMDVLSFTLRRRYEKCSISPELAEAIRPVYYGKQSVSHLSALLTLRDGVYYLSTDPSLQKQQSQKIIWGCPIWKAVFVHLQDLVKNEGVVLVTEDDSKRSITFKIPTLRAEIEISQTETKIRVDDPTTRRTLTRIVVDSCKPLLKY
uniref:Beta-Casp domain-containing protein n=1 Tax=Arcella intermedia TaxID=1963864 RepID=A0A6B2KZR5_9EUKA